MLKIVALYILVFGMMQHLAPSRDLFERHGELAGAIVTVLLEEEPLYRDDESRERTAALVVAVAYRESGLRAAAVGDGGHSVCALQIYDGPKELLADPEACVRHGLKMIRQSIKIDREHPLSFYARGPRYKSEEAIRISNDRVALAKSLSSARP